MNRSACIICSDYLTATNCTACPCGHTFHYECIITWREHSPTCPQCRVRFKEPIKLYFEQNTSDDTEVDSAVLKNQLSDLKMKMREKDQFVETLKKQHSIAKSEVAVKQQELLSLTQLLQNCQGTNDALKKQLSYMEKYKAESQRARAEAKSLEQTLYDYKCIQDLVHGEKHNVEAMTKNMIDPTTALPQMVTSFLILRKEFNVLKSSKKILENEKKSFRRKAEQASREAFEYKEQLQVLTTDLSHLNDVNKSLEQKIRKLEQAFASPSPRSSAIKRLLKESPAPLDLKRFRDEDFQEEDKAANGSFILFDGSDVSDDDSGCPSESININVEEKEQKELANEFGMNFVPTTSMTESRPPLKDVNKNSNIKLNLPTKKSTTSNSTTLPHIRKGFNGMGGQSKVLILPKRNKNFVKPLPVKREHKKIKIPKNNSTLSKFFPTPRLPRENP